MMKMTIGSPQKSLVPTWLSSTKPPWHERRRTSSDATMTVSARIISGTTQCTSKPWEFCQETWVRLTNREAPQMNMIKAVKHCEIMKLWYLRGATCWFGFPDVTKLCRVWSSDHSSCQHLGPSAATAWWLQYPVRHRKPLADSYRIRLGPTQHSHGQDEESEEVPAPPGRSGGWIVYWNLTSFYNTTVHIMEVGIFRWLQRPAKKLCFMAFQLCSCAKALRYTSSIFIYSA